jgi:hypothetical protein
MPKPMRIVLVATCFLAGIVSFLYLSMRNRDIIGEYYAESSVNIQMDSRYAQNVALAIETAPDIYSYWMSPTTTGDLDAHKVIIHISIPLKRPYWNPAIQIPAETTFNMGGGGGGGRSVFGAC